MTPVVITVIMPFYHRFAKFRSKIENLRGVPWIPPLARILVHGTPRESADHACKTG